MQVDDKVFCHRIGRVVLPAVPADRSSAGDRNNAVPSVDNAAKNSEREAVAPWKRSKRQRKNRRCKTDQASDPAQPAGAEPASRAAAQTAELGGC